MDRRSFLTLLPLTFSVGQTIPANSVDEPGLAYEAETCEFFWLCVWGCINRNPLFGSDVAKERVVQMAALNHLPEQEAMEIVHRAGAGEIGFSDIPRNAIDPDEYVMFERDRRRLRRDLKARWATSAPTPRELE
jgi:hypothetical protein